MSTKQKIGDGGAGEGRGLTEEHWTAEENGRYDKRWVLRYDPTPGGKKNADGSRTFSLSFPALQLTDWVADRERIAHELARELNTFPLLRQALEEARTDLMIAAGNADEAAKRDHRWEGVGEVLRKRVAECDVALAKARGEQP